MQTAINDLELLTDRSDNKKVSQKNPKTNKQTRSIPKKHYQMFVKMVHFLTSEKIFQG